MDKDLELKIENSVKEAMDDTELSIRLFRSRSVREFYQILSEDKNLDFSYDDFCDYSLKCEKLASSILHNERPYSKKAIELIKIYGDIYKNEKELNRFDSLKTLDEVLAYFNSLGFGSYSTNDVVEFFRFRCFVLFKRFNLLITRIRNNVPDSKDLSHDSYLLEHVSGGAGSKQRWLGGVLGALSMVTSGSGGMNISSARGRNMASAQPINASNLAQSVNVENLDYVDDRDMIMGKKNSNDDAKAANGSSSLLASAAAFLAMTVFGKAAGWMKAAGFDVKLPNSLEELSKMPEQIQKTIEMYTKMWNQFDRKGAIEKGKKVGSLISNSNDTLYNFIAAYVKGQDGPVQKVTDLLICPFLSDIEEISKKKMNFYEKYGTYPEEGIITPEEVRTYVGALYGERGVGKTRLVNIAKKYIFDPIQVPVVNVPVGEFDSASEQTFEEFLSRQAEFLKKVSDVEYSKRFVFCFDEVDKIKDPKRLRSFMEYVRKLSDKTQISYREIGGDGKFTGKTNVIQCEAGLVLLLSNAMGPNEKNASAWRQGIKLTDDESMMSRMFHIIFNPASDDTADSVMDTLIMEVQSSWYEANGINVEVDDTFTYNALAVLKYLGYNPYTDGVREVRNQIIPAMKTEFARKYTKMLTKYNELIASGKDPKKIRFLFRWEKAKNSGMGTDLRGGGKTSPIVPVVSCRYIDDVDKLGIRMFNNRAGILNNPELSGNSNIIWTHLGATDANNFKSFMNRLETWKLWANQCRVENIKQGLDDVAKFKIRDAYRMLRFCLIGKVASYQRRNAIADAMRVRLRKWKKSARLTVAEKELIFDGLLEVIEQWRTEGADLPDLSVDRRLVGRK